MAEQKLCKNDIAAVFKRLRSLQANKVCFDCGAKNPTWASVTYGVFICMDCSAVHRSLGVHLSFVRSTQLDTNWTWLQLRAMQLGGNANAVSFFQQHGCSSSDAQQKYNSRAAQLYREKLHQQAASAMRLHGTKLHIELPHAESPHSPEKREVDFFQDIAESHLDYKEPQVPVRNDFQNGSIIKILPEGSDLVNERQASELKISDALPSSKVEPRKSTISSRKPATSKKGLSTKKGFGAQRVTTNFSEVEKEAERMDRLKEESSEASTEAPAAEDSSEVRIASVRLAYKDLSLQQKQTEEKLRRTNPQKAEQLERLGMGFGTRSSSVGHSAASDMKLITQEIPEKASKNSQLDLDDDFEFMNFTSGPPKYGDSPFLTKGPITKGLASYEKSSADKILGSIKDSSSMSRKSMSMSSISQSDEAQKKFGNAKGISSEQFFGPSKDNDFEHKANLSRFEGSNSISSEDFFGENSRRSPSGASYASPNFYDIKEGVRDGVTKVAGRISSIANGVMSSLQRK